MEQTLCIIKPDGIRRALAGEIIARFEKAGFRIAAMKLLRPTPELAALHYTWEDIGARHGAKVRDALMDFLCGGPVLAFVLEGDGAIEVVRKLCGGTEPRAALPGTIRGDYAHHGYGLSGARGKSLRNLIHASANLEDARREIPLWFDPNEIIPWLRDDDGEHSLAD